MTSLESKCESLPDLFEDDLHLSIVGLGVEYAAFSVGPESLERIAKKLYPESNA